MEGISESLEKNQIIIYTVSNRFYLEKLIDVFKSIAKNSFSNIVYVTLNRPYEGVEEILKKNSIPEDKFFFIDITQRSGSSPSSKNSACVNPNYLTDISIRIFNILGKDGANLLLVDPVSTLLIYNSDISVMKFVHFIISSIRQTKNKAIFIFLKEDSSNSLFNDISMFSDKIVES